MGFVRAKWISKAGAATQWIKVAVGTGERHASGSREAWIAAMLLNGAIKVVITGSHVVSLMRACPHWNF
jgi:hypothetical protein